LGSPRLGGAGGSAVSAQKGVFHKIGEYWTVGIGGKTFQIRDSKGLAYLAHLLRYPATEFHVLDLAAGIADHSGEDDADRMSHGGEDLERAGIRIGSLGDAGEVLDDQARSAYRRRLGELSEELAEAKELGKIERAEQLEDETDALNKELARAVGLGGRSRRAASASERARQSVTKTLKAVLERIAHSDAALGETLARSIKTGNFCSYWPDPDSPIAWEFAATVVEPRQPGPQSTTAAVPADLSPSTPLSLAVSLFPLAERTTFVGREAERRAISSVIDRALNGYGSLVMIGGGPGVGKTRLATEMAEDASQKGFRCFVGHCYERDEPVPYLPFVEIIESSLSQAASLDIYRRQIGDNATELAQLAPSLRRVFPNIPPPMELPPAEMRRYLFQSLTEMLGRLAQIQPRLYVLEDLHWADESTLALLIHLANRIGRLPLVIVGSYRDGFSEQAPALVRTLEELIRLGIRPLKVGGLSKQEVAGMLNGLSQLQVPEKLVNLIFEESQGNPFFVEEVYRHLLEEGKIFDAAGHFQTDIRIDEIDVPENVRLITNRRLERLGGDQRRFLEAAAVIGRSFSFQLLSDVSQTHVDELFGVIEKAQQMGIVVPSSQGPETPFTFVHELVRQTLLAGISPPRRQRLHSTVAQAIERLYIGSLYGSAGEIADHLLKAGSFAERDKLVLWLTQSGRSALEAAAYEEARSNLRSALSHLNAADRRAKADLLTSLASAERGLGQWNSVLAVLGEALEIYIALGDRELIGKAFNELADSFFWASRFQETAETARRGLAYLQDVSASRARLLAILGNALTVIEGHKAAHQALGEALNIASQLSDPALESRLLGMRSMVNFHFFRLQEAAADGLRCEELGGPQASPWQRSIYLDVLYHTLLYLGRPQEAAAAADLLEPLATKTGQSHLAELCISIRAWSEFGKAPDLARLLTTVRQVSSAERKIRWSFGETLFEIQLGLGDFFGGNWAGGLLHAQAACGFTSGPFVRGFGEGTFFLLKAYAGDYDGALRILDEKRAWLPVSGQDNRGGSWWMLALVIEGLFMLGKQPQAAELYPLAQQLVGIGVLTLWPMFRFTRTIAGIAAAAAGQWESAEEHFSIALRQAESFPYFLEQAEIRRFHAMMLLERSASGDREKAQTLLRQALASYKHIGMPRHVELVHTLLDKAAG
jgi:predicted ATPase